MAGQWISLENTDNNIRKRQCWNIDSKLGECELDENTFVSRLFGPLGPMKRATAKHTDAEQLV